MGKCIIFVRVSTESQHTESQREDLIRAAHFDGFDDSNISVIENKESGYKLDEVERQGLQSLFDLIEHDTIDTIYIWELSRISRKPKILYDVRDILFENKIQLKCLNPQFSLLSKDRLQYDTTANIVFGVFSALTEQEIIEKKARFSRGKAFLASQSRYSGGWLPFGYTVDKRRGNLIIINEEEANIIHEIYDRYENGSSQTKIAKELQERGFARGTISFVHKMLTNELLMGIPHKSPSATHTRTYPQIITQEQFSHCREIAKTNNVNLSKAKNIYYADKLIRCQICGCFWSASGSKVAYHCYNAYNINAKYNGYPKVRCTNKISISINILDSLLWWIGIRLEEEFQFNSTEAKKERLLEDKKINLEKLESIANRISLLQEKKQRIMVAFVDGLEENLYHKKKEEIDNEIREVQQDEIRFKEIDRHIGMLINEQQDNRNKFAHFKEDMANQITDDQTRQEIIKKHIEWITIDNEQIDYQFKSFSEPHKVKARHIVVKAYGIDETFEYYFISNGNIFLRKCKDLKGSPLWEIKVSYLNRFNDKGKIDARLKIKQKRENQRKERISNGYLTINEASQKYDINYFTLANAIRLGNLKYVNIEGKKYVLSCNVEAYKKRMRKR